MSYFYKPINDLSEWKSLLKDGQWIDRYSAKELARKWFGRKVFPESISKMFLDASIEVPNPLFFFPEYKVKMPALGPASQSDIYIYAKNESDYWVVMIEGKAQESFGLTIQNWYNQNEKKQNRDERLEQLLEILSLNSFDHPPYEKIGKQRYQLFHRTAGAIIEAKRTGAKKALVLIHSLSNNAENFQDYLNFLSILSISSSNPKNSLSEPKIIGDVDLYFAWVE